MKLPKAAEFAIAIVIFLPLLFIDPKNSHDWGDDFAQYIHQAKNIVEGVSQSETGYLYNPDYFLGPPAYPVGFPLLLAPVYSLFGNNPVAFNFYMSAWLVSFAVLLFAFFRTRYSFLPALLGAVIISYNPWAIEFKSNVISDIPFSALVILVFILYNRIQKYFITIVAAGLLTGMAISIRSVGVSIFLAITIYEIFRIVKLRISKQASVEETKKEVFRFMIYASSCTAVIMLLAILFPLQSGYDKLYDASKLKEVFLDHLSYYTGILQSYFMEYNVGRWKFAPVVTAAAFITFMLIGAFKNLLSGLKATDYFVILYCLIIINFPYGNAGFRFLLPISPFLFNYAIDGFRSLDIKWPIARKRVAIILTAIILLQYRSDVIEKIKCRNCELPGPYEPESKEAFELIRNGTPQNSRILFVKARALALFTGRKGYSNVRWKSREAISAELNQADLDYFLISSVITDDSTKKFFEMNTDYRLIWNNSRFGLYQSDSEDHSNKSFK